MKIANSRIFILLSVFGIFALLPLSSYSGIYSITEGDYIKAYSAQIKKYYTLPDVGTQVDDAKKNTLDLIEYFLTTRADLSDFLWTKGANSGRQIRTILDMNDAPCVCDVNAACQATGDVCCCHKVQGVCDTVQQGLPKQWKKLNNCVDGCCGDYCCGQEPPGNCYSNKQCYITKGPCQACQKAGQDCVNEVGQCNVDADCTKYESNWICNPSFNCCVPPQVTTTTTTLAGCWSDKECFTESGPCYICPSFGAACTLQSNQCSTDSDCTIRYGKTWLVSCNIPAGCCDAPTGECVTDDDCQLVYGPNWACYSSNYCTYYGTNTNCPDGTRIGQCNSAQQRCMDGPYGPAILATDTTYC